MTLNRKLAIFQNLSPLKAESKSPGRYDRGPGGPFLDVARPRSDARPDFRSDRAKRDPGSRPGRSSSWEILGGDPPAGGPGKE
eukprot:1192277-Prorocentrum_minimum.AAC.4